MPPIPPPMACPGARRIRTWFIPFGAILQPAKALTGVSLDLTRFCGHPIVLTKEVHDAATQDTISPGIPGTGRRPGPGRADTKAGGKRRRQVVNVRAHLVVFVTDRAVPYTNNASERYLRPGVIFRKVTNGFRATGGAQFYAATRSVPRIKSGDRRGHRPPARPLRLGRHQDRPGRPFHPARRRPLARGEVSNYVYFVISRRINGVATGKVGRY